MRPFLKSITASISEARQNAKRAQLMHKLMQHEAKIGGTLFGRVPKGTRREFFCLDRHTWIWHEEFKDSDGQTKVVTTRYEIRPSGILKSINGGHYVKVSGKEARNLQKAARLYRNKVKKEVYNFI